MDEMTAWLKALGLERYAQMFISNEIDLDTLRSLTEKDLEDLGIAFGPRRKLLNALATGAAAAPLRSTSSPVPISAPVLPEGERRALSVLFADLTGYTALNERLDPEMVGEIMREVKVEAVHLVESFGGIVNQFVGDEILALFGVPVAHEDDPVRAVRTALALHARVRELSAKVESRIGVALRLHSGIDSGLVVTVSRDARDGTYGITGDTVNTAARLAAVSREDEIWVSPATYARVGDYFDVQAEEPMSLKGKAQPLTPYRIVGAAQTESRFEAARRRGLSEYTGRTAEIALMQASMASVLDGEGQFVAVTGEAGAGKSRLLFEFRNALDRNRLGIIEGRCQSYGSETPYLPFLDALRRALSVREEDSPETMHDKVVAQVKAIDTGLVRFLPHYLMLLSIASSEFVLPDHLQGAERRRAFEEALVAIFTLSAQRQPTVLILEDWHWADSTSDAVLKRLVELLSQYPLMVVLLTRPEYDLQWAHPPLATHIALKPLTVTESSALACTVLRVGLLPEALRVLIHQRTGGNPLFIEEVCHALVEGNILVVAENQATLTRDIASVQLPDTVQAVIRSRVDRLDRPTKEVLQLASVIGREFARTLLERIPVTANQLGDTLEALRTQDLIRQIRVVPEAEYIFKHVLTQVVVYETLLLMRRKALHELVGRAIEEAYAERIEEHYESLAYHYHRSDNVEKAIRFLELSGDKAKAQYVLQQTVKNYALAIELLGTQEKTPDAMRRHIDIAVKWADLIVPSPEVIAALKTAKVYAVRLDDTERIAHATAFLGQMLFYVGSSEAAIQELQAVIDMRPTLGDHDRVGSCYRVQGQLFMFFERHDQAIELVRRGLVIAEQTGNRFEESCSHGLLALDHGRRGRYDESQSSFRDAIRIAQQGSQHSIEAWHYFWQTAVEMLYGNWQAALHVSDLGLAVSRKIENLWAQNWIQAQQGSALFMSGEREGGRKALDEAVGWLETFGTLSIADGQAAMAEIRYLCGDYDEALRLAERAIASRPIGWQWGLPVAQRVKGLALARLSPDNMKRAQESLLENIALCEKLGLRPVLAITHFRCAELWLDLGDIPRARQALRGAMSLFSECAMTWWLGEGRKLEGRLEE